MAPGPRRGRWWNPARRKTARAQRWDRDRSWLRRFSVAVARRYGNIGTVAAAGQGAVLSLAQMHHRVGQPQAAADQRHHEGHDDQVGDHPVTIGFLLVVGRHTPSSGHKSAAWRLKANRLLPCQALDTATSAVSRGRRATW